MAKGHKPVAGSRAFWPKKRARGMYRAFVRNPPLKEPVLDFAGYKAGMTQVSLVDSRKNSPTQGKEIFLPATVLAVPNLVVCGIKGYQRTPYGLKDSGTVWAESLSKDLGRKTSLPKKKGKGTEGFEKGEYQFRLLVHTKPREAVGKKRPELFEIPFQGSWETAKARLGQELKASEVFREGEFLDVRAVDKGKGYQGPVKRFGVKIRIRKAKGKRRHVGSLGPRHPARIRPGTIAMAGQLGFQTRTEYNKQVLKIGTGPLTPKGGWVNFGGLEGNYLILKGSVPGPKSRLVMLRKGVRPLPEEKVEVKSIVLDSQQ